jgi:hypothetical protein
MEEISYGGYFPARVSLRLSPFIELSLLVGQFLFHGKAFGSSKLLLEWLSLFGRQLMVRSLP